MAEALDTAAGRPPRSGRGGWPILSGALLIVGVLAGAPTLAGVAETLALSNGIVAIALTGTLALGLPGGGWLAVGAVAAASFLMAGRLQVLIARLSKRMSAGLRRRRPRDPRRS